MIVASSAPRIALDASASARTSPKARSALIQRPPSFRGLGLPRGDPPERGAVLRVDLVALRGKGRARGIAELAHQATRQVARKQRAVLVARRHGAIEIRLAVALAR